MCSELTWGSTLPHIALSRVATTVAAEREARLSEEEAYLALRRQSRQQRKTMKEVAERIIGEDAECYQKKRSVC